MAGAFSEEDSEKSDHGRLTIFTSEVTTQPAFKDAAKMVCAGGVRPPRTPFLPYFFIGLSRYLRRLSKRAVACRFSRKNEPHPVNSSRSKREPHAIIFIMEVGDIHLYKERWKAVEEIERQELRSMSLEKHWQKLNAIVRFAIEAGMQVGSDDNEIEVFQRWAKIKAKYETGQKS